MRRTDEDFKAEVFRRCDAYRARKKKQRRMVMTVCLPVLLCSAAVMMALSGGFGGSTMEKGIDNAMSVECMEAPAAEAPAAAIEEGEFEPAEGRNQDTSGSSDCAQPQDVILVPADFAIRFVWAIGTENIYDTYTGQLQKDLVLDGAATAEFHPDDAVLEQIYQKITELDIASIEREMTSEVLTNTDEVIACMPLETYEIQFTMNGETYTVKGDDTAASYPDDEEAVHFMEFVNFMRGVAGSTPEYQSLPDANGGYD